jgi:hypothetical protein
MFLNPGVVKATIRGRDISRLYSVILPTSYIARRQAGNNGVSRIAEHATFLLPFDQAPLVRL